MDKPTLGSVQGFEWQNLAYILIVPPPRSLAKKKLWAQNKSGILSNIVGPAIIVKTGCHLS